MENVTDNFKDYDFNLPVFKLYGPTDAFIKDIKSANDFPDILSLGQYFFAQCPNGLSFQRQKMQNKKRFNCNAPRKMKEFSPHHLQCHEVTTTTRTTSTITTETTSTTSSSSTITSSTTTSTTTSTTSTTSTTTSTTTTTTLHAPKGAKK